MDFISRRLCLTTHSNIHLHSNSSIQSKNSETSSSLPQERQESTTMKRQQVTKHTKSHLYTTRQVKQKKSDTAEGITNRPTFVMSNIRVSIWVSQLDVFLQDGIEPSTHTEAETEQVTGFWYVHTLKIQGESRKWSDTTQRAK
jgi:hypothetical protein